MAGSSENVPPALELAGIAYRDPAACLPPAGRARPARQAGRIASWVRSGLADPPALQRLRGVTASLGDAARLESLLPAVLDGALALTGADFGNIQLLDPATGSLLLVTQAGFGPDFLEYFAVVDDDGSACGRAAQARAQTVIADVRADQGFAPHREIAAAAGFRAVQSTPLTDDAGRLIGMVSTHFADPVRPPARDLRMMELYSSLAGAEVGRRLGLPDGGPDDPAGRAVISALLGRDAGQQAEALSRLPDDVISRLFSAGLSLEAAGDIIGDGPAGRLIAAAVAELDRSIRDIRSIMFPAGS